MSSGPLHDALKPIAWLAGRWVTQSGKGTYPTIQDFSYHEVLDFVGVGQPMFNFTSTSTHPLKKTPMHQERGFLRIKPGSNELAFVVSHNFGLTTVEEGSYNPDTAQICLKTSTVNRMSFAKPPKVIQFERTYRLAAPDALEMVLSMQTENTPMTEHLRATYERVIERDGKEKIC